MLIPMVKILEKAFNKHEDDPGIQIMKGEMLIMSLETRFNNIEECELLLVSTCLHPIPLVCTLDLRKNF